MFERICTLRIGPAAILTMAGLICSNPQAWADLTVVSEITSTRSSGQSASSSAHADETGHAPVVVTTYLKGDKARVEASGAAVTIYDRSKERVYVLDSFSKTYTVYPTSRFIDQSGESRSFGGGSQGSTETNADLDLQPDQTLPKQNLAGHEAQDYTLSGEVRLRPVSFGGGGLGSGGFGGHHRRSGTGGGSGGGEGGGRASRGSGLTERVDGDLWLAGGLALPSKAKNPALPVLMQLIPANSCRKAIVEKLASLKGLPLQSKLTFVQGAAQSVESGGDSYGQPSTTVSTRVKSVSEATVDDAMFAVPTDYKEISAR